MSECSQKICGRDPTQCLKNYAVYYCILAFWCMTDQGK